MSIYAVYELVVNHSYKVEVFEEKEDAEHFTLDLAIRDAEEHFSGDIELAMSYYNIIEE